MAGSRLIDSAVDLVTFELLEQVALQGSLSTAATALGVSQQAASARMRRMEARLGVRLVHRGAGGSTLTEQGGTVLEWGAPVLEAARRAAASLEALAHHDAALTVAASQTVAEALLPGWLRAWRLGRPDAAVRLLSGNSADVMDQVRAGRALLGFIEGPEVPEDLTSAPLARDELLVVVGADHPWADGRTVGPVELGAVPLLLRERGSGTRAVLERWLLREGASLAPPAAELGTTAALRAAAASGAAPAVLSRLAVTADLASGRLLAVPLSPRPIARRFSAVWTAPELGTAATDLLAIAGGGERVVQPPGEAERVPGARGEEVRR